MISTLLLIAVVVNAVAGFYIFYNFFTKKQQADSDRKNPAIMIIRPSTANSGDVAILNFKNTGTVDMVSWTFTTGLSDFGGSMTVGSQRSFSAELSGVGPWIFTVQAQSKMGDIVEDTWVIENL